MRRKISTRFRVTLGLVGLLTSLLLVALLVGFIPDRQSAVRQGRAALAESLALTTSMAVAQSEIPRIERQLSIVVDRNSQLLSAAVRREDHYAVVVIGDHANLWQPMRGEYSSDSQVLVPIFSGKDRWGQLELRFTSTHEFGVWIFAQSQVVPLVGFMAATSFVVFYFYLGQMLKHLDPSRAIPPRVRAALDTMAEGLLVLDLKGQIVLANSALAKILDKDVDGLLGRNAHEFAWQMADGSPLSKKQAPWTQCLAIGEPQRNVPIDLLAYQGNRRSFLVNCSPVMSAGGKYGGVLVSFDDVTQLEEKKLELGKAKEAAEAANRAKSEFLANMSHEIRTPMNAILGFTDILRRGYGRSDLDPRKHLNTIHSSGKHLLELINDILDLSKVEAGRLDVECVPCQPHVIVGEVIKVLSSKANEKEITLTLEADGPIPESIQSDPSRLRQIVTNLVGNAIKFTTEGGVRVILSRESADQPKLRIDVCDSGIGMSQEQMDKIFDPFSQADSSVTRRFGGTGLGLTISRRFAEALGGGITVLSEQGLGSVFTVRVNTGPLDSIKELQPDQIHIHQDVVEHQTGWRFESGRVLVVDDGEENRELATLVLEEAGLVVEGAENGQVGAEMALNEEYDLILMDMQMPVMNGYDAIKLLRRSGLSTPIYALTANAMKGFEKKCLEAGCTGFLTKPIDIDLLLETVASVVGGTRVENTDLGVTAQSPDLQQEFEEPPLVSTLPLDVPRFATVVDTFVQRLEEELPTMYEAAKASDFERLIQLAHWLKGSGGTVGFPAFTAPASRLETSARVQCLDDIALALAEITQLARRINVSSRNQAAPLTEVKTVEITDTKLSSEPTQLTSSLPTQIPKFRRIVENFVPRLNDQLNAMDRAYHERNFAELAKLAHWLKGAGGTVGFAAFTQPATALEVLAKEQKAGAVEVALQEIRQLATRIRLPEPDNDNTKPQLVHH